MDKLITVDRCWLSRYVRCISLLRCKHGQSCDEISIIIHYLPRFWQSCIITYDSKYMRTIYDPPIISYHIFQFTMNCTAHRFKVFSSFNEDKAGRITSINYDLLCVELHQLIIINIPPSSSSSSHHHYNSTVERKTLAPNNVYRLFSRTQDPD